MRPHKLNPFGYLLILLIAAAPAISETAPATDAPTDLDRFIALAGTWEGTVTHNNGEPEPATVTYRVTAGGSAVSETLFADTPHEMLTVFYMDEGKLSLTHYCMLKNQPEMSAVDHEDPNTLAFRFTGGDNIKDPSQGMHMHEAAYTFTDKDHLTSTWVMHHNGEPAGGATLTLQRVKD